MDAGAHVLINGRDPARVKATVEALRVEGGQYSACSFDVIDPVSVDEAITRFEADSQPVDILINNAAVVSRRPLDTYPTESWRGLMATNLEAPFTPVAAGRAGDARAPQGQDHQSPLSAVSGRLDVGTYYAPKAGLQALTRAMTLEWGRENVQVNAIGPGWFMTDMVQTALKLNPQLGRWVKSRTPAGRWGDPATDLTGPAIFFASAASDYVGGQTVFVDGGHLTANGM